MKRANVGIIAIAKYTGNQTHQRRILYTLEKVRVCGDMLRKDTSLVNFGNIKANDIAGLPKFYSQRQSNVSLTYNCNLFQFNLLSSPITKKLR